ncbi:DUF2280 domain-containing protein [Acinetobacter baumannii]|nr:DUF2280 domain-containing protein [Acinetobacter baumannii]
MAALKEQVKIFIVQALACMDTLNRTGFVGESIF